MKITLISPRIAIQKGDFLGSGIPYWPVDLAVLAAFLCDRNHEVFVIDLFGTAPTTLEEHKDYYLQGKPITDFVNTSLILNSDLLIIYAISYMSHKEILTISRIIKNRRPEAKVIILENSQAVTAYAISEVGDEFFDSGVDALLCGEVYANWDQIQAFLMSTTQDFVPQNVLLPGGGIEHVFRRQVEKISSYPVPAWELFPIKNYWGLPYSHGPKNGKYLPILTSRGCPYPCDFCVIPETNIKRWRAREPQEVVNEILALRDRFGVKHFQIEDVNPTISSKRWEEICDLLIEKKANIFFYFVSGTKAETVKLEQVPLLSKAGCRYLSISPESGSPSLMKIIGKPFDYAHGLSLVQSCRTNNISTQACFLVGHPNESPQDHELSCRYLASLVKAGLDEAAIFIVAPQAGSFLYKKDLIGLSSDQALISFSPKGRTEWRQLALRRKSLINIFFKEKFKKGLSLWLQGLRALLGKPKTKMENLPWRFAFVCWLIFKFRVKQSLQGTHFRRH